MGMRISVIIGDDGQASVEGPLQNKVICYGLLQVGMDLVRSHKPGLQVEPVVGLAAAGVLRQVVKPS